MHPLETLINFFHSLRIPNHSAGKKILLSRYLSGAKPAGVSKCFAKVNAIGNRSQRYINTYVYTKIHLHKNE